MPLTETIPKPMIKVGNMPIIERQIRHLCAMGIREVYISTNYLGKIIEEYFETHTSIDASIEYIREEKFLGTAGPISLMPKFDNLLLINGDLLSDVNYVEMYKYHLKHKSSLTIGAVNHHFEIPYGVLEMNGEEFLSLREKPSQNFLCNAGIYIMTSDNLYKSSISLYPAGELSENNSILSEFSEYTETFGVNFSKSAASPEASSHLSRL